MPLQDKTAEKMLNNVADFIASTQAKPDQRAWDQLLIYCPRKALERRARNARLVAQDMQKLQSETAPLEQAKKSVLAAAIGSCECNTKSPDAAHHLGHCRYLKLLTALDCIDAALSRS